MAVPGDPGALSLDEIRTKYKGAYNDVPDWKLAGALYDKYYASKGISEGDFYKKIGFQPTAADTERREHRDWSIDIPGAQTVKQVGAQALTGTAATIAGAGYGIYKGLDEARAAHDDYHLAAGPAFDVGWGKMKEAFHAVQQKYTYGAGGPDNYWAKQGVEPMSQTSQWAAQKVNAPVQWATDRLSDLGRGTVVEPTAWAAQKMGADPSTVKRIERVGSDVSDIAAPFALGAVAGGVSRGIGAGARALRGPPSAPIPPNVLQGARNAGYRIPDERMAAAAGSSKVNEALSRYHEGINNQQARRTLGLQEGNHPIDVPDLEKLRADAHTQYQQALRGNVNLPIREYTAFQSLISDVSRNIPQIDALLTRLAPNERGFLVNDVNKLIAQFAGKRTFDAKALATRMETLRRQWDAVKNIDPETATGAQIREYVLGMSRRNMADVVQQVLNWHDPRMAQVGLIVDHSFLVEDARHPGTGNISAHDLMQLQDTGRTLPGNLQTVADVARHAPNIVQDLDPVQAGLLSPQSLGSRWARMSWPERLRVASTWLGIGIPMTYEALAHKALAVTAGKAGAVGYGAYKATQAGRAALRRALLGHRYHQRFYPPSRWAQPAQPPTQPMGGVARTAVAGTALSEMDRGDLQ